MFSRPHPRPDREQRATDAPGQSPAQAIPSRDGEVWTTARHSGAQPGRGGPLRQVQQGARVGGSGWAWQSCRERINKGRVGRQVVNIHLMLRKQPLPTLAECGCVRFHRKECLEITVHFDDPHLSLLFEGCTVLPMSLMYYGIGQSARGLCNTAMFPTNGRP